MMTGCRAFLVLWVVAVAAPASAQTSRIEGGSVALGAFTFYYETRLMPPMPPLGDALNMLVLTTPPNVIHRVMFDRARKVYFGYDARVSAGGRVTVGQPDEVLYSVTFAPLSMTSELRKVLGPDTEGWKLLPAPRFPAKETRIRPGEAIELALLSNDTWGQTLTEYVTVQEALPRISFDPPRRREFVFPGGTTRDFSAADAMLSLIEPRVTWTVRPATAGQEFNTRRNLATRGDAQGGVVWVYLPGAGRFLLSLIPRGEFTRAGTVRGTSLTFTAARNTYNITSASRIAPGDAAFNVYVLHQPGWKPDYPNANVDTVHIGAADRAEYLLQSR